MAITTSADWRQVLHSARSTLFSLSLVAATIPVSLPAQAQQIATLGTAISHEKPAKSPFRSEGSGTLLAMAASGKTLGKCPLKHTDVKASISGYIARVRVKQTFQNTYKEKIEAVYTFPLSDSGAVDRMVMKVGDRTIDGVIKKREEARQIYDEAKAHGHVASLLNQERTNIFTQSVANIEPGQSVEITLEYVDLMPYESGQFTFAFPTVVGPRFNPGRLQASGTGSEQDTDEVPDASRITPTVTPEGTRAGHDISIAVDVDAGVKINDIRSRLHDVAISHMGESRARIELKDKSTIPNKDFVLVWNVAGSQLKSGYLTYRNPAEDKSGYFTLMMLPPKRVTAETVAPKEMIFLIDCSGSQSGAPLQKAKDAMNYILDHMNPNDTFQIVAFSNTQSILFEHPERVSSQMKSQAHTFINALQANGGTWMAPAVEKVCAMPADANRLRIVTFMTDGYVGNDYQIIGMIKKLREKSRWFPFGTGNSVNRNLIDNIAREGGGEPDYVLLNSNPEDVGSKFYKRISSPVLTDVKIDFGGLPVKEVFPKELNDVWAEKPLYFEGRYVSPAAGTVTISGFAGGKPYKQTMNVQFPEQNAANDAIGSIWARAKVDRLMAEDWFGAQSGQPKKELKDEIVQTALDHHIMTQYTSFVAVEETKTTKGGAANTVNVPVEMPDGVTREGVYGNGLQRQGQASVPVRGRLHKATSFAVPGAAYGGSSQIVDRKLSAASPSAPVASPSNVFAPRAQGTVPEPAKLEVDELRTKRRDAVDSAKAGKKEDAEKALVANTKSTEVQQSKLSEILQKLLNGSISTTEQKSLHMRNGLIAIKVSCSATSKDVEKALSKAGLKGVRLLKAGMYSGEIASSDIKMLSALNIVIKIEAN